MGFSRQEYWSGVPLLCLAQCYSPTTVIHKPGRTVESPGELSEAFPCPVLPLATTRDCDFVCGGYGPDTRHGTLLCFPDARFYIYGSEVRATENFTPIGEKVITLITKTRPVK